MVGSGTASDVSCFVSVVSQFLWWTTIGYARKTAGVDERGDYLGAQWPCPHGRPLALQAEVDDHGFVLSASQHSTMGFPAIASVDYKSLNCKVSISFPSEESKHGFQGDKVTGIIHHFVPTRNTYAQDVCKIPAVSFRLPWLGLRAL